MPFVNTKNTSPTGEIEAKNISPTNPTFLKNSTNNGFIRLPTTTIDIESETNFDDDITEREELLRHNSARIEVHITENPGSHQSVTSVNPGSHQSVTNVNLGSHQSVTSVNPGSHQSVTNVNPGSHQSVASVNTVVRYAPETKTVLVQGGSRESSRRNRRRGTLGCCLAIAVAVVVALVVYIVFAKTRCADTLHTHNVCLSEECVKTAASLLSSMDQTAVPCSDFYQYACGMWNKKHVIPQDKSSISIFEVMADQLQIILKGVLEEPISDLDNSATSKAKQFYNSCVNVSQIKFQGDAPLRQVLDSLGGWPVTKPDWQPPAFSIETLLSRLKGEFDEGPLITQWVGPDDKNSTLNILQLDQLELALPTRDFYLTSNGTNPEDALTAYHRYMTEVAILLGADPATAATELEKVIEFEKELANASIPAVKRLDTGSSYQKLTIAELQEQVPELNWLQFLSILLDTKSDTKSDTNEPVNTNVSVVALALPYFVRIGKILEKTDRRVVHNYVLWRFVMNLVPYMIGDYQQKLIEFHMILNGILSEPHRWSQCVEWTNKKMGLAVGALFIKDNFDHGSKVAAMEMIRTLREAFNELLSENHWMDNATISVAKEKADAMTEKIGYPEILTNVEELEKEYVTLNVTEDQFLVNMLNMLRYEAYHNMQKLRHPVNKDKWGCDPAVVNAFYNPNKNDIVFPAGILQPKFYSQHSPKSINYGGIGVVIGHEITHGFDDKGRQFDKDGNMMQWWDNATIAAFRNRTKCMVDQYSGYKLEDVGMYVDGLITQGENIADNGGLKQSFRAYKKWVSVHGEEPNLPGLNLTHDQLFFLNYAQIWCGSMRLQDARTKIRSAVHPPGLIRVLGPLSNSHEFARAYNCPVGSPMNPRNKCSVW